MAAREAAEYAAREGKCLGDFFGHNGNKYELCAQGIAKLRKRGQPTSNLQQTPGYEAMMRDFPMPSAQPAAGNTPGGYTQVTGTNYNPAMPSSGNPTPTNGAGATTFGAAVSTPPAAPREPPRNYGSSNFTMIAPATAPTASTAPPASTADATPSAGPAFTMDVPPPNTAAPSFPNIDPAVARINRAAAEAARLGHGAGDIIRNFEGADWQVMRNG